MFVLSLFTMSVGEVRASEIAVDRFAKLALACVHKEYPSHISHSLRSDDDVAPPRELTPAFYGCLDWHSSVHGHWLLARVARLYPESEYAPAARAALAQSLTAEPHWRMIRSMDWRRIVILRICLEHSESMKPWITESLV